MKPKLVLLIGVILLVGIIGFFYLSNNPTQQSVSGNEDSSNTSLESVENGDEFVTNDRRIAFDYPQNWFMTQTTPSGGVGEFGTVYQSWTLQNFETDELGAGGIPQNTVKIDFEIIGGGESLSLDDLVTCDGKTVTCERIGIDNEQFIKGTSILNTGVKTVTIATFYDDKVFKANALIQTGDRQAELTQTVEQIFNSITFSQ